MNRIQYIDAMRGFTMFLVVLGHVSTFCLGLYGSDTFSYTVLIKQFWMPLFFFVSGFVFFKHEFVWSLSNALHFLRKKTTVQILSPALFLIAFCTVSHLSLVDALFDYQKGGYWFTFTLFEYFCFYIFFQQVIRMVRMNSILEDVFLLTMGGVIYMLTIYSIIARYQLNSGFCALIGVPTWHNFLFFLIGTRVRKHFPDFERLLDNDRFVLLTVCTYIVLNIFPETSLVSSTLYNFLTAITGIFIVFALFRRYQDAFSSKYRVGRVVQFVGRRTLDIYLIHYFFVMSNMQVLLPDFGRLQSPFLEFLCSSAISTAVIICCLGVSCVLRLSPTMAHFLFGQKNNIPPAADKA